MVRQTTHFKKTNARAKKLRRDMTNGEWRLWLELRAFRNRYGLHVRRQVPIGPYVADFAFMSKKLVIELDGEFHFTPEGLKRDTSRDAWFAGEGFRVLKIKTNELEDDLEGCINTVIYELGLMH